MDRSQNDERQVDNKPDNWYVYHMKSVGLFEAKTKLSEICNWVADRRRAIVVTRRGKPLVRIEPIPQEQESRSVWQARDELDGSAGPIPDGFELPPRDIDEPPDLFD